MPPKKGNKRAGKPRPTLLAKGINSLSHAQVSQSGRHGAGVEMTMTVNQEGHQRGWVAWGASLLGATDSVRSV
jgi:hypothetical protein